MGEGRGIDLTSFFVNNLPKKEVDCSEACIFLVLNNLHFPENFVSVIPMPVTCDFFFSRACQATMAIQLVFCVGTAIFSPLIIVKGHDYHISGQLW